MRSSFPATFFLAFSAAATAAIAEDSQTPSAARNDPPEAVHVQPRGRNFVPRSPEDDDIQRKLTTFNAERQILDEMFDRKLTICRRC
jgi:hypothetical protein